ncbi:LysR family transcriptional regulator [Companilactobacillus kimchiensis]|uniref:LysR family transcriptional regulator n=1 Tax=Companilactobacillus kimchiensis TaxID=993692 RepID=UPI0007096102|nr:LysR family transcriptional regulator [Companilactobacillus kimchiensis]
MDLQKLKVLVDLAETLNYTETAENLFTTQGNISKQILTLEKELDVTIFVRAHRKIVLTPEGKLVLTYAQKITRDYAKLTIQLSDLKTINDSTIELHTIPTMPNYQSFTLITQFLQKYPKVQLQLQEEESYNLLTSLKAGKCEMIFARTFQFDEPNLERIVMEDDDFVAVLPKNHPYAQSKKLDLAKLKDERFLILGNSTNLYTPVLELCKNAGFKPQIAYEGTRVDLIMRMVQNQMGISLMMGKTAQNYDQQKFSFVPLTSNITNKLCFIRIKGEHSKANNLFWKYVQDNIRSIGG